jgi:hypothetical protein
MRLRSLATGLAALAGAAVLPVAEAQAAINCNGAFEAHVRSGTNADLSLVGRLRTRTGKRLSGTGKLPKLTSCSGELTGKLRGPAQGDRGVWGYALGG